MLSIATKARLKTLLLAIADGEIALEDARQALAAVPQFEPYAAFNRLDRSGARGVRCGRARQEFLRGIAHNIRWAPVNGTVKHAALVRFQNQTICPL